MATAARDESDASREEAGHLADERLPLMKEASSSPDAPVLPFAGNMSEEDSAAGAGQ
jgi:hypothetical protein